MYISGFRSFIPEGNLMSPATTTPALFFFRVTHSIHESSFSTTKPLRFNIISRTLSLTPGIVEYS
jgi:hypothetical protein